MTCQTYSASAIGTQAGGPVPGPVPGTVPGTAYVLAAHRPLIAICRRASFLEMKGCGPLCWEMIKGPWRDRHAQCNCWSVQSGGPSRDSTDVDICMPSAEVEAPALGFWIRQATAAFLLSRARYLGTYLTHVLPSAIYMYPTLPLSSISLFLRRGQRRGRMNPPHVLSCSGQRHSR